MADKVEEMKPEEALENLDRACSQINTSREVHLLLMKSVSTLKNFITQNKLGG